VDQLLAHWPGQELNQASWMEIRRVTHLTTLTPTLEFPFTAVYRIFCLIQVRQYQFANGKFALSSSPTVNYK